jgi:hypothetical protein
VTLDGVTIKPALALGGWVAFKPMHGDAKFSPPRPGDIYEFRLLKPEERNRDENRTTRATIDMMPAQKKLPDDR